MNSPQILQRKDILSPEVSVFPSLPLSRTWEPFYEFPAIAFIGTFGHTQTRLIPYPVPGLVRGLSIFFTSSPRPVSRIGSYLGSVFGGPPSASRDHYRRHPSNLPLSLIPPIRSPLPAPPFLFAVRASAIFPLADQDSRFPRACVPATTAYPIPLSHRFSISPPAVCPSLSHLASIDPGPFPFLSWPLDSGVSRADRSPPSLPPSTGRVSRGLNPSTPRVPCLFFLSFFSVPSGDLLHRKLHNKVQK